MPQSEQVLQFIDKLGFFYEVVDDKGVSRKPAGDRKMVNGHAGTARVNNGLSGGEDSPSRSERESETSNGKLYSVQWRI